MENNYVKFDITLGDKTYEITAKKQLSVIDAYNVDCLLNEFYGSKQKRQESLIEIENLRAELDFKQTEDTEDNKKYLDELLNDPHKLVLFSALTDLFKWRKVFEQVATLTIALVNPPFEIRNLNDETRTQLWNKYEESVKPFRSEIGI